MIDIEASIKRLIEAREAYYGTGHAIMTDEEYDSLEDLVKSHAPDHPFFETIGHPVSSAWEKAEHTISMGSLEKVNTEEEFMKWVSKFPPPLQLLSTVVCATANGNTINISTANSPIVLFILVFTPLVFIFVVHNNSFFNLGLNCLVVKSSKCLLKI